MSDSSQTSPAEPQGASSDLLALRRRIDDLDAQLVDILTQRLEVCHDVARLKERSDTPIIQPQRVRDVITRGRQSAIDKGVDPDFVEQVMRVVLAETHRIEVAGRRLDRAPDKTAVANTTSTPVDTAMDTVISRVDHVVVAVADLALAVDAFMSRFGFHRLPESLARPGIEVIAAGGVTLVLVGPEAGPEVAAHIATHGSGIHHVALEVLNAQYARSALLEAHQDLDEAPRTDLSLVVDDHGHEQFFTVRDPASGVRFGFIARTGHRLGVATQNVLQAFRD